MSAYIQAMRITRPRVIYPVLPKVKQDLLPNWFYPMGKTYRSNPAYMPLF